MKGASMFTIVFLTIVSLLGLTVNGISQAPSESKVAITDLSATETSESIEITFRSLTDNIRYYVIEKRQSDKLAFIKVGHLLASDNDQNLYYNDTDTDKSTSYQYRVKTIYNDGRMTTSDPISCTTKSSLEDNENVHKYIFRDDHNISMRLIINHETEMEGGFYDNAGKLIQKVSQETVNEGLNEFSFDISTFKAGNYLLIIKVGKENIIERTTVES
jgi:hypothetical protein